MHGKSVILLTDTIQQSGGQQVSGGSEMAASVPSRLGSGRGKPVKNSTGRVVTIRITGVLSH